jgi:multidrug efflux pump subunit AcrA (membrane-fusion protein)
MSNIKKISLVIGLVAIVGVAVIIGRQSGGTSTNNALLITPRAVERRDLSDVLTVTGEVRRDETKKINSAVDGKVSQINVEDGDISDSHCGPFCVIWCGC